MSGELSTAAEPVEACAAGAAGEFELAKVDAACTASAEAAQAGAASAAAGAAGELTEAIAAGEIPAASDEPAEASAAGELAGASAAGELAGASAAGEPTEASPGAVIDAVDPPTVDRVPPAVAAASPLRHRRRLFPATIRRQACADIIVDMHFSDGFVGPSPTTANAGRRLYELSRADGDVGGGGGGDGDGGDGGGGDGDGGEGGGGDGGGGEGAATKTIAVVGSAGVSVTGTFRKAPVRADSAMALDTPAAAASAASIDGSVMVALTVIEPALMVSVTSEVLTPAAAARAAV